MSDCIFCKIIAGEIPSEKVYEDELVYAFKDIEPKAPIHYLIIPKEHIETMNEATLENRELFGHLFFAAKQIAKREGFDEEGYRTTVNCNENAGQLVFHLHMHLFAGVKMAWNPA